jgi:hypothetical protein
MNAPTGRTETTALARSEDTPRYEVAPMNIDAQALVLNPEHLKNMMAVAELMAMGVSTVPKHLQKNKGDCLAIVMQAVRWHMDPFAVAQKTHVVSGTMGYEAQLVAAVINSSGALKERLRFEWFGPWEKIVGQFKTVESKTKKDDDGHFKKYIVPAWNPEDERGLGVKVWGTLRGETEPRELVLLMAQARTRNSGLWTEDPKQQLAYLAEKRWSRLHLSDVLMGIYTPDELDDRVPRDMGPADVVGQQQQVPPELLKRAKAEAAKGVAAYTKFWKEATNLERAQLNELSDEHEALKEAAVEADKKRTVDNAPKATPAPTAAPTTAAAKADPATGEISAPAEAGPFVATYAKVLDLMLKATDAIGVEVAAEWIQDCPEHQRAELEAKRDEILAGFKKGAQS